MQLVSFPYNNFSLTDFARSLVLQELRTDAKRIFVQCYVSSSRSRDDQRRAGELTYPFAEQRQPLGVSPEPHSNHEEEIC